MKIKSLILFAVIAYSINVFSETYPENHGKNKLKTSILAFSNVDQRVVGFPLRKVSKDCVYPESVIKINQSNICEAILSTPICAEVPENNKINCSNYQSSQVDYVAFFIGCTKGLFNSAKELLQLIWDIMKWVWNTTVDSEYRTEQRAVASEYSKVMKQYLITEYDKAYLKTTSPFRSAKALTAMGGSIAKLIFNQVSKALSKYSDSFSCLNQEAQAKKACKLLGDIVLPPVAIFNLIKYGIKSIKHIPEAKKALSKPSKDKNLTKEKLAKKSEKSQRITDSEQLLGKTLNKEKALAIEKAHLFGSGKAGKDGGPAKVGNYTWSQLK